MERVSKSIVIWGAGRIGRGFIGDLFHQNGYRLTLVDQSQALVDQINSQSSYSVFHADGEKKERIEIRDYQALHTGQKAEIQTVFNQTDLMAVSVFPQHFEQVALQIQSHLLARREEVGDKPFNILLCTNLIHAGPKFEGLLTSGLSNDDRAYFKKTVGVIETLVIRICPEPPDEIRKEYPLVVWTNGYPELPIDVNSVKGDMDFIPSLRLVNNMRAEEIRKIYTYNMCHAVLSYHGHFLKYNLLVECLADPKIREEALGTLGEVSTALQMEYGFTEDEMQGWINGVLSQTNNPIIGDTVLRSAADPVRKLQREDRLIGPLLLCRKNDIEAPHLIQAIGAAYHFHDQADEPSCQLQQFIEQGGIENTIHQISQIDTTEDDIIRKIINAYHRLPLEYQWIQKARAAYQLGFSYEQQYHGCGQSVLAAVMETLDVFEPKVFESATGLCGGIGLKNDASCSSFIGGVMAIGLFFGRKRENFDGDRHEKYLNFKLVQKLHDRFIKEYGSITCGDIHTCKYGRSYDLSNKEDARAFEEKGAHSENGCTQVVGSASQWTVEIIADEMIERTLRMNVE